MLDIATDPKRLAQVLKLGSCALVRMIKSVLSVLLKVGRFTIAYSCRLLLAPFRVNNLASTALVLILFVSYSVGVWLILFDREESRSKPPSIWIEDVSKCGKYMSVYATAVEDGVVYLAIISSSEFTPERRLPEGSTLLQALGNPNKPFPGIVLGKPCSALHFSIKSEMQPKITFLGGFFDFKPEPSPTDEIEALQNIVRNSRRDIFDTGYKPLAQALPAVKLISGQEPEPLDIPLQTEFEIGDLEDGALWPEGVLLQIKDSALYMGGGSTGLELFGVYEDQVGGPSLQRRVQLTAVSSSHFHADSWSDDRSRIRSEDSLRLTEAPVRFAEDAFIWKDGRATRNAAIRDIVGSILIGFAFTLSCEQFLSWVRRFGDRKG